MGIGERQRSIRAMRGQLWSPGRPSVARRVDRQRFWRAVARGGASGDAGGAGGGGGKGWGPGVLWRGGGGGVPLWAPRLPGFFFFVGGGRRRSFFPPRAG